MKKKFSIRTMKICHKKIQYSAKQMPNGRESDYGKLAIKILETSYNTPRRLLQLMTERVMSILLNKAHNRKICYYLLKLTFMYHYLRVLTILLFNQRILSLNTDRNYYLNIVIFKNKPFYAPC